MAAILRSNYPLNWLISFIISLLSYTSFGQAQTNYRLELMSLCEQALQKPADQKINQLPILIKKWEQSHLSADSTYIKIHIDLAKTLADNQHQLEAISLLKKVILSYRKGASALKLEDLAKAYHRLGICYQHDGNFVMASKTMEQGIQVCHFMPASRWVSYMHSTLAFYLYQSGDYEQALAQSEQSIKIGEAAHSDRAIANGLFEKAKALREIGRIRETRPDLERAIHLAEQNSELAYDLSLYYVTLAYVCKAEANPNQAIRYFQKAISLNRQLNDSLGMATNSTELGYFLYAISRYDAAERILAEAIPLSPVSYVTARTFDNLGAVYWKKRQYNQALIMYQRGLHSIIRKFKSQVPERLPSSDAIRSSAYKEYILTLIQDKADTWLDYAKATGNNRQRFQYALETYRVADQMIDFMRWEHTGQQSKLFWRNKTRGMYERAIETCHRLGDAAQAFRFMEKSRSVMLADKLNELSAQQKLTHQQLAQEEHLQQAVSNQQSKLADIKPGDSTAYNQARMDLFAKQDSLTTFLKQLEVSNPAYYNYKYDNKTVSLPDLQHYLKQEQSSLITYFVGDSALYLLGVTGDRVVLRKQSVGDYTRTLGQFAPLLNNPEAMGKIGNIARFRLLSNSLYGQLMAPLALPKGRVLVSPDGFFIPFEALSRSATQLDYAVNDYAFSYEYSVSLLLKSRATQVRTPGYQMGRFLGVAPVEFAPSLKQVKLPDSDVAVQTIAGRFTSPTLLTHKAATRRAFLTEAANARIIHLFTHATADSTDREPTLYFADSTLQLSDLGDNTLPKAQLVVLAACKTAIGANQRGEGVFSLARGFAAIGVPSVLTTLWSVQNEATYQLTDLFYKYMDAGLPKDIALQRAKQEWLKIAEGSANQLPNYWAGLIVVGDTEPLPSTNYAFWGAGLFVLLVIDAFILWRERRKRPVKRPVSLPHSV